MALGVRASPVADGRFPSTYSLDDDEIEEERRLLYVACTRARENLILSYPTVIHERALGPGGGAGVALPGGSAGRAARARDAGRRDLTGERATRVSRRACARAAIAAAAARSSSMPAGPCAGGLAVGARSRLRRPRRGRGRTGERGAAHDHAHQARLALVEAAAVERVRQREQHEVEVVADLVQQRAQEGAGAHHVAALGGAHPDGDAVAARPARGRVQAVQLAARSCGRTPWTRTRTGGTWRPAQMRLARSCDALSVPSRSSARSAASSAITAAARPGLAGSRTCVIASLRSYSLLCPGGSRRHHSLAIVSSSEARGSCRRTPARLSHGGRGAAMRARGAAVVG